MNKKKIATLLLVGTLLVGGGALGAKAWFSAETKVESNLVVTTGTLKLVAENDDTWVVDNKTQQHPGKPDLVTEVEDQNAKNNFFNVRPGDSFVKTVSIKMMVV